MGDFAAHVRRLTRMVDGIETHEVRVLLRDLRDARHELEKRITLELSRVEPSSFTLAQRRQMQAEIKRIVYSTWSRYAARLPASDKAIVEEAMGAQLSGLAMSGERIVGGATLSSNLVMTSSRYEAMLTSRSDSIKAAAEEQVSRLSRIIRNGILQGEGPYVISGNLARSGWLGPLKRSDGSLIGVAARGDMIARTEVNRTFNIASQVGAEALAEKAPSLKLYKSWVTAEDERVRPTHETAGARYAVLNRTEGEGPIVMGEDYEIGGHPAAFPQDPRLPAEESINCRCRSVTFSQAFLDEEREAA